MIRELDEFVKIISDFISSNEASRILVSVKSPELTSLFVSKLLEKTENVDPSFDTLWLNRHGENIGVEEIGRMADFLKYAPSQAKHRYVIADEFSNASREAAAALLKITEEPPPYAVFLLFTSNLMKILPTVRSRFTAFLMKIDGRTLLNKELLNELEELIPSDFLKDPSVALYAARFPKEIIEVFSVQTAKEAAKMIVDLVKEKKPVFLVRTVAEKVLTAIKQREYVEIFSTLKKALKEDASLSLSAFLDAAIVILQDLAVLKKSNYWRGIKRMNHMDDYLEFRFLDVSTLKWILECRAAVSRTSVNTQTLIGLLLAKFILMKTEGSEKD